MVASLERISLFPALFFNSPAAIFLPPRQKNHRKIRCQEGDHGRAKLRKDFPSFVQANEH